MAKHLPLLQQAILAWALCAPIAASADPMVDFKRAFLKDCARGTELFSQLNPPEQEQLIPFLTGALNVRTRPPPEPLQPISTTPPLGGGPTTAWRSLPSDSELHTRRCAAELIRSLGARGLSASHDLFAAAMTTEPLPAETRSLLDLVLLEILGVAPEGALDPTTLARLIEELRGEEPALAVAALGSLPSTLVVPTILEAFINEDPEHEVAMEQVASLHEADGQFVSQTIRAQYPSFSSSVQRRYLLLLDHIGAREATLSLSASSLSSEDIELRSLARTLWERTLTTSDTTPLCSTPPAPCDEIATELFSRLWGHFQGVPSDRDFTIRALAWVTSALPAADERIAEKAADISDVSARIALLRLLGSRPFSAPAAWELVRRSALSNQAELREAALAVLPKSTASSSEILPLFRDLIRVAPDREHPAQRERYLLAVLRGTSPFLVVGHSKALLGPLEELIMSEVESAVPAPELHDTLTTLVRSIGTNAIPAIRNALRSRSVTAQRRALLLLREIPPQGRIVTDVAPFLSSTDERIRDLAVDALVRPEIVTAPALFAIFPRLRADTQEALAIAMAPHYPNQPLILSAAQSAVGHLQCGALRSAFRSLRRLAGAPLEQLERRALHCMTDAPSERGRTEAAEALADLPLSSDQNLQRLNEILRNVLDGRERVALYRPFLLARLAVDTSALVALLDRYGPETLGALELLSQAGLVHRDLSPQLEAIIRSEAPNAVRCLAVNELVQAHGEDAKASVEPLMNTLLDLGEPCLQTFSADALLVFAQLLAQRDDGERVLILKLLAAASKTPASIAPFVIPYRASPAQAVMRAALLALVVVADDPTAFRDDFRALLLSRKMPSIILPQSPSAPLGGLLSDFLKRDRHPLVRRRAALALRPTEAYAASSAT